MARVVSTELKVGRLPNLGRPYLYVEETFNTGQTRNRLIASFANQAALDEFLSYEPKWNEKRQIGSEVAFRG